MRATRMAVLRFSFLLVAVVIAVAGIAPQTTHAAEGNTAQIRIFMFECDDRRTPDLASYDKICVPKPVTMVEVVKGENQRGEEATWKAEESPECVDYGVPGLNQISNWWWRFDKTVTIRLANGEVVTVKQKTSKAWLNVGLRFVHLNIAGLRSPGYTLEVVQYETDK